MHSVLWRVLRLIFCTVSGLTRVIPSDSALPWCQAGATWSRAIKSTLNLLLAVRFMLE